MIRPLLLQNARPLRWGSCVTIADNLHAAYRAEFGPAMADIVYDRTSEPDDVARSASAIFAMKPTHLIFTNHERHPHDLLQALDRVYGKAKWPTLVFHVFGDFTLQTHAWLQSEKVLKGKRTLFVCASSKQREFVKKFMAKAANVSRCHFPISAKHFGYSSQARTGGRARWGVSPDEFLITYTGRLSLQKNVLSLVREITSSCGHLNIPFKLLLAGPIDDIGSPFFGIRPLEGSYFQAFQKLMNGLSDSVRSKIQYLGRQNRDDLYLLYNAADLFVSFSTYHDEDYGLSPVEALACGTPALLSDWGGFSDFARAGSCDLLPVELGRGGARVKIATLDEQISSAHRRFRKEGRSDREERSNWALEKFGSLTAQDILRHALLKSTPVFGGFTAALRKHALSLLVSEDRGFVFNPDRTLDPTYKLFYQPYAQKAQLK